MAKARGTCELNSYDLCLMLMMTIVICDDNDDDSDDDGDDNGDWCHHNNYDHNNDHWSVANVQKGHPNYQNYDYNQCQKWSLGLLASW